MKRGVLPGLAAMCFALSLATGACSDDPKSSAVIQSPAAALLHGLQLQGDLKKATLIDDELPSPTNASVGLLPFKPEPIKPPAPALLSFDLDPPSARSKTTAVLMQFGDEPQYMLLPTAKGDTPLRVHVLFADDLCSTLCDIVHRIPMHAAVELSDGSVSAATTIPLRLDCRETGAREHCSAEDLVDSGVDSGADSGRDAGPTSGPDSGADAGPDAGPDAATPIDGAGIMLSQSCTTATRCMAGTAAVSCCETTKLPAGSYVQGPDVVAGGASRDATIGEVWLDRFEVSVGRFRRFVDAYEDGFRPSAGQGAHPQLPGTGWRSAWDAHLPPSASSLRAGLVCDARFATWRDLESASDDRPINCVDHTLAAAFCLWDGGRLPTEAEWEYAAVGGDEARTFPWGDGAPDTQRAVYNCLAEPDDTCTLSRVLDVPVGARPAGEGRFGQFDLAGGMSEWVLDNFEPYDTAACSDCAAVSGGTRYGLRGGSWLDSDVTKLHSKARSSESRSNRRTFIGFRCAYDADRLSQF